MKEDVNSNSYGNGWLGCVLRPRYQSRAIAGHKKTFNNSSMPPLDELDSLESCEVDDENPLRKKQRHLVSVSLLFNRLANNSSYSEVTSAWSSGLASRGMYVALL